MAKIRGANPPAEILMNSLTHPENFDYQVEHAFLLKDNYGALSVMSHALIDLEIPNNAHFFFFLRIWSNIPTTSILFHSLVLT